MIRLLNVFWGEGNILFCSYTFLKEMNVLIGKSGCIMNFNFWILNTMIF